MDHRASVKPLGGCVCKMFLSLGEGQHSHQALKLIPDLQDWDLPCCLPMPIRERSSLLLFCWVAGHCSSPPPAIVSPP